MIVDFARNEEGREIEALFEAQGSADHRLCWDQIHPWWLIAKERHDTPVIAAVQMIAAQPIGRLEMLVVDETKPRRTRVVAVGSILDFAYRMFSQAGISKVQALVTDDGLRRFMTKRFRGVIMDSGVSMEVDIFHEQNIRRQGPPALGTAE